MIAKTFQDQEEFNSVQQNSLRFDKTPRFDKIQNFSDKVTKEKIPKLDKI